MLQKCASGSVGGARPCQGRGRGFESRLALFTRVNIIFMREWLSWWSTTLPRSGSRVRVPSRAFFIYKRYPKRIPFVYKRVLPDSKGSRSPLCSGRCRTDIHRMSCTVSRSNRKKLESIYARVLPDSNVQGQDCVFLVL